MEREMSDELRFHFEQEAKKYELSGMTQDEAIRRARLAFGGREAIEEACREARGTHFIETSMQDAFYGLRAMRKHPGFFSIALATLALGIGCSAAVFSIVNRILLKPLPYPDADRIVIPWRTGPIASSLPGLSNWPWSPKEFSVLSHSQTVFQSVGGFKKDSFNLTGSGNPELLEGVRASAGFFPALGVAPLIGRTFTAEEDRPGNESVAVLSYGLWHSHFGGDRRIVGSIVHFNGIPYTVVGVMPPAFNFPNTDGIPSILDLPKETQLWVPMALPADPRGANELGVIGRLKPNVTSAQVQQDMRIFEQRLQEQIPQEKGWSSRIVPLTEQTVTDARRPLLLLLGAVTVVLLIACSNVAGLTLNRSLARRRELTMRGALGAQRSRLVRQLLIESLLLAVAGGFAGVLLGGLSLYLAKFFGPNVPHLKEAALDLGAIAYAVGITVVTGVLFGVVPAIGATRLNMVEALKEGGPRSGGGSTAPRLRNVLLIAQVGLAMVLMVAAGLLVRTFYFMLRSKAGFDAARVVSFELPLPSSKYADTARMTQLYQDVLSRLRALPDVRSAGLSSVVPMGGAPDGTVIRIPEHPTPAGAEAPYANYSFISPGYFSAIGTPLVAGRDVTDADILTSMPVTIINVAMARKYFRGEDPIGKQVGVQLTRFPTRTIIGVVADIKHESLREEVAPEMFVPFTQNEIKVWPSMQAMQFAVLAKTEPAALGEGVRRAVHNDDPDLPVAKFAALSTLVESSVAAYRFSMLLVAGFAVVALILASIGMFGVISYGVMQRTPEIGVRMALGAKRWQILLMILGQAGRLAGAGIGIGVIAALATTHLMSRFLYGIRPGDPLTFVALPICLLAVVLMACLVPVTKAMKIDPLLALRYE